MSLALGPRGSLRRDAEGSEEARRGPGGGGATRLTSGPRQQQQQQHDGRHPEALGALRPALGLHPGAAATARAAPLATAPPSGSRAGVRCAGNAGAPQWPPAVAFSVSARGRLLLTGLPSTALVSGRPGGCRLLTQGARHFLESLRLPRSQFPHLPPPSCSPLPWAGVLLSSCPW